MDWWIGARHEIYAECDEFECLHCKDAKTQRTERAGGECYSCLTPNRPDPGFEALACQFSLSRWIRSFTKEP